MKKIDILKKIEEQVARGILNPNSGEPVGLKITKQNLKKSKEENEDYYKKLEKKFRDYLKLDTKDNPSPKVNMTDKDHEMYYGTGMEGLKYDDEDTEKYKKFVERNKKLNEPSKDYYLKKDQVEDSFGKITKDGEHYKKHKYGKPDEYQKTPKVRITNENHNKNTMKRLTYKKPFLSHDKTMNLIPEGYKQDGNKFQMTDGVETYTIKWEGTNTTGTPTVLSYKNEKLVKEDITKMEYLYDYNSSDLLMKTNDALTENTIFNEMLNKTRSLLKEQQTSGTTQVTTKGDGDEALVTTLNGVKYKLPKIKTDADINNFMNWNPNSDVITGIKKLVGEGRAYAYPFKEGDKNSAGSKVYNSMTNLLKLHAILGQTKPYNNLDTILNWKPTEPSYDKDTITEINDLMVNIKGAWDLIKKSKEDSKNYIAFYQKTLKDKI